MISKKYRLTEKELKKVLSRKKPFFSYGVVANTLQNTLGYARIGIVISGKQARGSVNRNFFRRRIYDLCTPHLNQISLDIVFVIKKGVILDHKDEDHWEKIRKDVEFLWKNIEKSRT